MYPVVLRVRWWIPVEHGKSLRLRVAVVHVQLARGNAHQVLVKEADGLLAQEVRILVPGVHFNVAKLRSLAIPLIEVAYHALKLPVAVYGKQDVLLAMGHQQGARGNQGALVQHVVLVGVDAEHAVAMVSLGIVLQVCGVGADAHHGHHNLHARVHCRGEEAHRGATGPSGHTDAVPIHLLPRFQVVDGPHRVPYFHARRSVASREPVKHFLRVYAVVKGEGFCNLDGIQDKGCVPVLGQRDAMTLILRLVAKRGIGVPTHVDDCGYRLCALLRNVQIATHVHARHALKRDLFNYVAAFVQHASHAYVQWGSCRPGKQSEHVAHLLQALRAHGCPSDGVRQFLPR